MTQWAHSEIVQLTSEIRKLRYAVERTQQALMNGRDAARYLGYSHVTFRSFVKSGAITPVRIDPDAAPRYSRAQLDELIRQRTEAVSADPLGL